MTDEHYTYTTSLPSIPREVYQGIGSDNNAKALALEMRKLWWRVHGVFAWLKGRI